MGDDPQAFGITIAEGRNETGATRHQVLSRWLMVEA